MAKTGTALFMRPVADLKAWELYTGQSIWFFFIGIVFFLFRYLLDMTFLKKNTTFQKAYRVVEKVGTGEASAKDGAALAGSILK